MVFSVISIELGKTDPKTPSPVLSPVMSLSQTAKPNDTCTLQIKKAALWAAEKMETGRGRPPFSPGNRLNRLSA
jgi:hypothetical protein